MRIDDPGSRTLSVMRSSGRRRGTAIEEESEDITGVVDITLAYTSINNDQWQILSLA